MDKFNKLVLCLLLLEEEVDDDLLLLMLLARHRLRRRSVAKLLIKRRQERLNKTQIKRHSMRNDTKLQGISRPNMKQSNCMPSVVNGKLKRHSCNRAKHPRPPANKMSETLSIEELIIKDECVRASPPSLQVKSEEDPLTVVKCEPEDYIDTTKADDGSIAVVKPQETFIPKSETVIKMETEF